MREFIKGQINLSGRELADLITMKTAEVEGFTDYAQIFENMVVGEVLELKEHPNADALKLAVTNIGKKKAQIICGGSNLKEGMKVAVALPGAKVRWHGEGDLIELEAATIRGEESYGMICASNEIGMGESKGKEIMDISHIKSPAGTPLADALDKQDLVFEIDNKSLTHRPDLWGHLGFARELALITETEFNPHQIETDFPAKGKEVKLKVKDKEIINRWNSLVIEGITVKESPQWLRGHLEAVGVTPVNNIVDITNYVMLELGQPMHAYDADVLGKLNLEIRFAKKDEILETIDHKNRKLTKEDAILLTNGKPTMLLGIMGGANSEINDKTTTILLESANFDSTIIRKASQRHGLRTDASQRFEKSLDPHICELAIKRAYELIVKICPGAQASGPLTDKWITKPKETKVELNTNKVRSFIGVGIHDETIKKILEQLEFLVKEKKEHLFEVTIPSFRATKDVNIEVDLIEEVARIYGYEQIEPNIPQLSTKVPTQNLPRKREHQAREILSSLTLTEVLNYSFYSKTDLQNCFLEEESHLKLKNYLSEEQTHMRTSLLPNILKNIHLNLKNFDEIQIFEIGRTYPDTGEFFPAEEEKIALAVVSENSFLKLKGILQTFFEQFSHQHYKFKRDESPNPQAHPNKAAVILDETENQLATIYNVHPLILENFDLETEIAYAEVNLGRLVHDETHSAEFTPLPKYPDLDFDISVVIDKRTSARDLEEAIKSSSDLIHNIELFDLYEGENIPQNKKALAYKVTLRNLEKTLTDEVMTAVQEKAFNNLTKLGGEIRGR